MIGASAETLMEVLNERNRHTVLWDTDAFCADLLDDGGFLATFGRARGKIFTDADFDEFYPSDRGRPSHPPSVMPASLLAQLFFEVSDREAERRPALIFRGRLRWACRLTTWGSRTRVLWSFAPGC